MGFSAFDSLPPLFSDYVISRVAAEVANATETSIWSGSAGEGNFDGFSTLLAADSSVVDVAAGGAITSSNVIAKLGATVDAANDAVLGKEDLTLYVSTNIARAYIRALGGFATNIGANGVDNKGTTWYNGGALTFEGINIFVAQGLGSNKAVLAQKSNLFFGTGLLDDRNEVKVIDMADIDGSQNVRIVMRAWYVTGLNGI